MSSPPSPSLSGGDTGSPKSGAALSLREELQSCTPEQLLQRVEAVERQLKIRNADCARLLHERQQLLPLKEKVESQREMILALREQLALARAQMASAVEALEAREKADRDAAHQQRVQGFHAKMNGAPPPPPLQPPQHQQHQQQPSSPASPSSASRARIVAVEERSPVPNGGSKQRRVSGGTVVATGAGPQIILDSSDISSVGFSKRSALPYDFLGGPMAQQQYREQQQPQPQLGPVASGSNSAEEDDEVARVMDMAREAAMLDIQYAQVKDHEEEELRRRVTALRQRPPRAR